VKNDSIKDLWKASEKKASAYYQSIEPALLVKAQKKSEDIFTRLRRKTYAELGISAIIALAFPWLFLNNKEAFTGIYIFMVIALGLTTWFYLGFLKKINSIQEHDVFTALIQKETVLSRYVRWQHILSAFSLLLGGFFGLFINMEEGTGLLKTGLMILIMLPLLFLAYLLVRRYIHTMYGKHLEELREILEGLKGNGEQHVHE